MLNHDVLAKEIDPNVIEGRLLKVDSFKAKDIFNVLHVCTNKELVDHVGDKCIELISTLIPEEVVILNKLIDKHAMQGKMSSHVEKYIDDNIEEMETLELAKVYTSCIRSKIALSTEFKIKVEEILLHQKLFKASAHSLPYLLPLVKDTVL